jgi:hypothetical protein
LDSVNLSSGRSDARLLDAPENGSKMKIPPSIGLIFGNSDTAGYIALIIIGFFVALALLAKLGELIYKFVGKKSS